MVTLSEGSDLANERDYVDGKYGEIFETLLRTTSQHVRVRPGLE